MEYHGTIRDTAIGIYAPRSLSELDLQTNERTSELALGAELANSLFDIPLVTSIVVVNVSEHTAATPSGSTHSILAYKGLLRVPYAIYHLGTHEAFHILEHRMNLLAPGGELRGHLESLPASREGREFLEAMREVNTYGAGERSHTLDEGLSDFSAEAFAMVGNSVLAAINNGGWRSGQTAADELVANAAAGAARYASEQSGQIVQIWCRTLAVMRNELLARKPSLEKGLYVQILDRSITALCKS